MRVPCPWMCGSRSSCCTSACWWITGSRLASRSSTPLTTKILHHPAIFQNDFIFVRPAVSTEHIERCRPPAAAPTTAPYPKQDSVLADIRRMVLDPGLHVPFEDFRRDTQCGWSAQPLLPTSGWANFQIRCFVQPVLPP